MLGVSSSTTQQEGLSQQQQQQQKLQLVKIRDLRPAPGNVVNTQFIILEKYSVSRVNEGGQTVCTALVADNTSSVHLLLWGPEIEHLQPGHIVCLTNGIFSFHKNTLVLRAGKKGTLEKIGEFTMSFVEEPNMSRVQWVQDPSNPKHWLPAGGAIPVPRSHHQQTQRQ